MFKSTQNHMNLLDTLLKLRNIKDKEKVDDAGLAYRRGICYWVISLNTSRIVSLESNLLDSLWEGWEYYTGDSAYPIPYSKEATFVKEDRTYVTLSRHWRSTPKWSGEQGELRLDLLNYLIKELQGILHT